MRDLVRAQFEYQGRTIYTVDTAGWLQRSNQEKGLASLSIMESRRDLMRAHADAVALVLDAEKHWREGVGTDCCDASGHRYLGKMVFKVTNCSSLPLSAQG